MATYEYDEMTQTPDREKGGINVVLSNANLVD